MKLNTVSEDEPFGFSAFIVLSLVNGALCCVLSAWYLCKGREASIGPLEDQENWIPLVFHSACVSGWAYRRCLRREIRPCAPRLLLCEPLHGLFHCKLCVCVWLCGTDSTCITQRRSGPGEPYIRRRFLSLQHPRVRFMPLPVVSWLHKRRWKWVSMAGKEGGREESDW